MSAKRIENLRRLLKPRHVAFVGGQGIAHIIGQCIAGGFAGPIWVVNPKYAEIAGVKCFPSIAALPAPPDATFIAVPREPTIGIVEALAGAGAGGCVCYAAGYAEVGGEGVALQKRLVAAAGDLALVGPNSYGLVNYLDGIVMFGSGPGGQKTERGAAIIMQSGNIALTLTFNQRSVPFSTIISAGNQAVLTIADYVDGVADDPRVTAIGLYVEGLTDIAAFSRAAARALRNGKPIVAMKAGRSELGAKLAMSHTSSLAGSDKLYDSLFARLGVLRVESITALLETIKYLSVAESLDGDRLAVFTCSGGDSLMAADRMAKLGIGLPQFSEAQHGALRRQLPDFATIANPLDYNTSLWGNEPALRECFGTVLGGGFDAGMLVIDYPTADPRSFADCDKSVDAVIAAARAHGRQPIVATTLSESFPETARRRLIAQGCPPMQGLEEALEGFAAGVRYSRRRAEVGKRQEPIELPSPKPMPPATRLWSESEAKLALAAHGLASPRGKLAASGDVAAAAQAIGFPVVLKLAKPVLAHKTEAGAVAVGLGDADAVARAVTRMTAAAAAYKSGLRAETFLVERQVSGAVAEMIIGVKRDPLFGLVLVIGAGGVLVELAEDAATLLLPTHRAAIEAALLGLRAAKLLHGFRGRPVGDVAAVVDAAMAVAAFAEAERDRLVELDVNPLLVLARGQGAVAVDALVVTAAD